MQGFKDIVFGESSAEIEVARYPELVTKGYYHGTRWANVAMNGDKFLAINICRLM